MKLRLTFLLLLFAVFLAAQTTSVRKSPPLDMAAKPEDVGMSAERLERITTMLESSIAKQEIPGAVALVARNGKIVYWKAFGMADNAAGRPLKKDDIFRIASQTKAITSVAAMMLWEQGKFQLDDPVSKYIPAFKNPQVLKDFRYADTTWTTEPAKSEVTVRQLLNHTSGIGYGVIDGDERFKMMYHKAGVTDLFTTENIAIKESVERLAKLPLHHQPGEKYTYGEGLDVLGYLIEIWSGEPFDVYLKNHVFGPLKMNDTYFYLPDTHTNRLVSVQQPVNGKWERYPVTFYDPAYPVKGAKRFFSGGAGLSSTVKDYATFLQMLLNGGELNGQRLLSRTTVSAMLENQTGDLFGWGGKNGYFSLAFSVVGEGGATGGTGSEGTFGWGGYFNTSYFADPKEKIIGLVFKQTQNLTSDETSGLFRQLVFQSIDD